MQALVSLRDDPSVAAIVIACAGRTFVAGADITEFGKPVQQPDLRALIVHSRPSAKPDGRAAIFTATALGGGLELALGCPPILQPCRYAGAGLACRRCGSACCRVAAARCVCRVLVGEGRRALGMIVSGNAHWCGRRACRRSGRCCPSR